MAKADVPVQETPQEVCRTCSKVPVASYDRYFCSDECAVIYMVFRLKEVDAHDERSAGWHEADTWPVPPREVLGADPH